jgi:hypothetical protein
LFGTRKTGIDQLPPVWRVEAKQLMGMRSSPKRGMAARVSSVNTLEEKDDFERTGQEHVCNSAECFGTPVCSHQISTFHRKRAGFEE